MRAGFVLSLQKSLAKYGSKKKKKKFRIGVWGVSQGIAVFPLLCSLQDDSILFMVKDCFVNVKEC